MKAAALTLALLLTACSSLPPAPPQSAAQPYDSADFSLNGRISARNSEHSFAGLISWQHTPTSDEVTLSSPLGQGVARIASTPAGAVLEQVDGSRHSADNAETLTETLLGWRLPLTHLGRWVNDHSTQTRLSQDGWQVDYIARDARQRPTAIDLSYGEVQVKLRAINWFSAPTNTPPNTP